MEQSMFSSPGQTLDAWFKGQANDDDLIAHFLPTQSESPLNRLRQLAQSLNFAKQMMELTEFAILREGEKTAKAIHETEAMLAESPDSSMLVATKLALEDHYSALQLLVEAGQKADEESMFKAIELAEQASSAIAESQAACSLVREHLSRIETANPSQF